MISFFPHKCIVYSCLLGFWPLVSVFVFPYKGLIASVWWTKGAKRKRARGGRVYASLPSWRWESLLMWGGGLLGLISTFPEQSGERVNLELFWDQSWTAASWLQLTLGMWQDEEPSFSCFFRDFFLHCSKKKKPWRPPPYNVEPGVTYPKKFVAICTLG